MRAFPRITSVSESIPRLLWGNGSIAPKTGHEKSQFCALRGGAIPRQAWRLLNFALFAGELSNSLEHPKHCAGLS